MRKSNLLASVGAALLTAVLVVGCGAPPAASEQPEPAKEEETPEAPADPASMAFGQLLADLVTAYETPSQDSEAAITSDLAIIRSSNPTMYETAASISDEWHRVYLDPSYSLCLWAGGETAPELAEKGLPDSPTHAFVVLGYELKDGQMTDELKGRCDAAIAAAKTYPNTILVCTGGATGKNNPERHTEAGLMKQYFVEHGIDAGRVFADEQAMTTAENARNSMDIMRQNGVQTMTIITSSYHQQWGQTVYYTANLVFGKSQGYSVEILGDFSYDTKPSNPVYTHGDRIAVRQIGELVGLPKQALDLLPSFQ